jgi:adenosine deaminase
VWGALKLLGAQRIDHGIHSLEDPKLVEYMASHQVPITLCPISNTKLQVRNQGACALLLHSCDRCCIVVETICQVGRKGGHRACRVH